MIASLPSPLIVAPPVLVGRKDRVVVPFKKGSSDKDSTFDPQGISGENPGSESWEYSQFRVYYTNYYWLEVQWKKSVNYLQLLVDEFVIKLDYLGRKKESGDGFFTYLNKADFEKETEGYITSCYQSSVIDVVNAFYDELFDKDKIQQLKTLQGELEKTQEVEVEIIREIN